MLTQLSRALVALAFLGALASAQDNSPTRPDRLLVADPGRCTEGESYWNLTTHSARRCTANNVWSPAAPPPAVGGAVTGGAEGSILFVHPAAKIAQAPAGLFKYDISGVAAPIFNSAGLNDLTSG